jgi:alanine dehydrogenase
VVARTSTYAFLNAALPYIIELVTKGIDQAIADNPTIESGVSTYQGKVRHLSSLSPLAQLE